MAKHGSNAVHITIYSQNGKPVPNWVLEKAAEAVTEIAQTHSLLIATTQA